LPYFYLHINNTTLTEAVCVGFTWKETVRESGRDHVHEPQTHQKLTTGYENIWYFTLKPIDTK